MIPIIHLTQSEPTYPAVLQHCLDDDAPNRLTLRGSLAVWSQRVPPLTALFCSGRAPAGALLALHDWARANRQAGFTIISGFHAPAEQEAMTVLLGGKVPLIHCPARSVETMRLKATWRQAIEAGRLVLLSPFGPAVRRGTVQTGHYRNRFIAALADELIIAHARPGSKTEALVTEAIGWGKPVWTLSRSGARVALE